MREILRERRGFKEKDGKKKRIFAFLRKRYTDFER